MTVQKGLFMLMVGITAGPDKLLDSLDMAYLLPLG